MFCKKITIFYDVYTLQNIALKITKKKLSRFIKKLMKILL